MVRRECRHAVHTPVLLRTACHIDRCDPVSREIARGQIGDAVLAEQPEPALQGHSALRRTVSHEANGPRNCGHSSGFQPMTRCLEASGSAGVTCPPRCAGVHTRRCFLVYVPSVALEWSRDSPLWLSKIEKGHPSQRRVAFTSALEFRLSMGAGGGIRTLDLLFTNLLVDTLSLSTGIHGCRIFPGFSLRRFDSDPRLCMVIYPLGCQFGCQEKSAMRCTNYPVVSDPKHVCTAGPTSCRLQRQ